MNVQIPKNAEFGIRTDLWSFKPNQINLNAFYVLDQFGFGLFEFGIQTAVQIPNVWEWNLGHLSKYQTSLDFRYSL